MKYVTYALSLGLIVAWMFTLRPTALGGPAGYVMVSGISMQPTLYTGDLVITRKSDEYRVGDVVAFRAEGGMVIHRIIDGDGDTGFILQGDNNEFRDQWRPTTKDI